MRIRCPHCHNHIEVVDDDPLSEVVCQSCGSTFNLLGLAETTPPAPSKPRRIGHFELIERVGVGQFGSVWKAVDTQLDRTVAVKIPRKEQLDEEETEQFLREARAAAQLRHPNIVSVHEVGRDGDTIFIVSDFVPGANLKEYLSGGPLTVAESVKLCVKVASALHHAHLSGVVHRDLKPGNIMLDVDNEPHILDFGLAKREAGEITMTVDGRLLGTPAYMPPEQARGEGHQATRRSDIYSLGVILYELLTGELPFRGETRMVVLQILRSEPASPRKLNSAVPRDLETIVLKCLEKDPGRRYQTAQELAEDLQRWLDGKPIHARPVSRAERALRWCRRNPAAAALILTLGLSLAAVLIAAGTTVSLVLVTRARNESVRQRQIAEVSAAEAQRQKKIAQVNAAEALRQKEIAEVKEKLARSNEAEAVRQRGLAEENERIARTIEAEAVRQREIAEQQRALAQYEAYVNLIGTAAARIEENAFAEARQLLASPVCKAELRAWEWGRLMHICSQSVQQLDPGARVESVAFAPDGNRIASGGWDGTAIVWQFNSGHQLVRVTGQGQYVYGVAFSPDGRFLATGSNHPESYVRIWDAANGQPVSPPLPGHTDAVTSVTFSRSGRWLLTTSFDRTARLWNVQDVQHPVAERTLAGHDWWVWDAAFSPDETKVVTASQDGTALVWTLATGEKSPPFTGHQGPVYSAAFLPDGESVATGGYDKRVLLWRTDELEQFDFETLLRGGQPAPARYRALEGHTAAVRSVAAVGAAGKTLVLSAGHDNTIKLWDADSRSLLETIRGHGSWIHSCDFSPDGDWVLSGGYDRQDAIKLWNIDGYEETRLLRGRVLRGHRDAVMSVAFSADGSRIVTASQDRTARIWDAGTGQPQLTLEEGHGFLASAAAFFPDGRRLATSAADNSVRVWDIATGVEVLALQGTGRAAALAVAAGGQWILTGSDDQRSAQLWDANSGERIRALEGHREVTAVAFSASDQLAATGDVGGRVRLWDLATGQLLKQLDWHTSKVTSAVFLPDGSRLLTASDDKTVAQWDVRDPGRAVPLESQVLLHPDSVNSLSLSASGELALTSCADGKVRLWNVDQASLARELSFPERSVNFAALAPNQRLALTVHPQERQVRLWDLDTGEPAIELPSGGSVWSAVFASDGKAVLAVGGDEARLLSLTAERSDRRFLMQFGPHATVSSAHFSPDGRRVVTASWDNSVKIWDAASGKALRKLSGVHQGYVNSVVCSSDGQRLLTASDDGTAALLHAETGDVLARFAGHAAGVRSARFSPDGSRIVTASDDKTARIWDADSGELLKQLARHQWAVLAAAFSIDGERVITGSEDNTAQIWDARTGEPLYTLSGHTAAVTSVALSPDGRRALTGSADFTARLWDVRTGKEMLSLKGHTEEVTSVTFSPDGRQVLTGSRDGTTLLWLATDWHAVKDD